MQSLDYRWMYKKKFLNCPLLLQIYAIKAERFSSFTCTEFYTGILFLTNKVRN